VGPRLLPVNTSLKRGDIVMHNATIPLAEALQADHTMAATIEKARGARKRKLTRNNKQTNVARLSRPATRDTDLQLDAWVGIVESTRVDCTTGIHSAEVAWAAPLENVTPACNYQAGRTKLGIAEGTRAFFNTGKCLSYPTNQLLCITSDVDRSRGNISIGEVRGKPANDKASEFLHMANNKLNQANTP